jgi:hypothetical protein
MINLTQIARYVTKGRGSIRKNIRLLLKAAKIPHTLGSNRVQINEWKAGLPAAFSGGEQECGRLPTVAKDLDDPLHPTTRG